MVRTVNMERDMGGFGEDEASLVNNYSVIG
jgi:hypothetical protein